MKQEKAKIIKGIFVMAQIFVLPRFLLFAQEPSQFPSTHARFNDGNPWPKIEMPIYRQFKLYNHPTFGWQVQKLGDVNGDGYGDFAVTTYTDTTFIFFGGPLLDSIPDAVLFGGGGGTGINTITAGDVNGDGYPDIISAEQYHAVYGRRGCVRLYMHNHTASMYDSAHTIEFIGKYPVSGLGYEVIMSGDFNGDGKTDLLMTSQDQIASCRGVVYLYLGKEHPDTTEDHAFAVQLPPGSTLYPFGDDIRVADINGDGCDDIFIHGTVNLATGWYNAWYVFLGNKEAKYGEPDRVIHADITNRYQSPPRYFDFADINGDKCADMIECGGPTYNNPRVAWGNPVVPNDFLSDTVIQNPGLNVFDFNVKTTQMGDMDGDGIKDYFMSWDVAMYYNAYGNFFYRGGKDWNKQATAYFSVGEDLDLLNFPPHDIGDITGDGLSDVAITSHFTPDSTYKRGWSIRIYRGAKYLDGVTPMSADETKPVSFKINAYPNPLKKSSEQVTLDMELPARGILNVKIYDMLGRELYGRESDIISPGSYLQTLPYAFPSAGMYFIQIGIGNHFVVKSVSVV